ncbi:GNAT family N-acetyltransferase [Nocardia sp. NPDC057353]|uniref:GNAT family N-acetyltransferase n=1 Tax=Nocardia sp. NPDC057353 TaxID=3346104 RepID=UPI003634FEE2
MTAASTPHPALTVRPATARDVRDLARVLGLAFADDPVMAHLLPDARTRAHRLAAAYTTLVRHHFLGHGGVDVAADATGRMVGAAVWAPPGAWHAGTATLLRELPGLTVAFRGGLPRAMRLATLLEAEHPPEPHWYLAFVGTLPEVRGRGAGHALIRPRLERCDADGVPAYLESSKPQNLPYYERFGFDVTGEFAVPGAGPPLWPMWRAPR